MKSTDSVDIKDEQITVYELFHKDVTMKKNFIFTLLGLTLSLQAFAAPVKACSKQKIRYGTVVTYNTLEFCMNQTVTCNNATFGDPIYGTMKQCRDRFNNVVATEGKSFIVK